MDDEQDVEYYVAKPLKKCLDAIKKKVNVKDMDSVYIVDGMEGSGKSLFAMQLGYYLDRTLNLNRICMTPDEFRQAVIDSEKGQVIIFDEAYRGLSSRQSLSEINRLLVSMMMEMRQKNLIVFIVIPTIFMLDRYVILHRAIGLFHIYMNKNQRGYWQGYNYANKKQVYLIGRKTMSYRVPFIKNFKGRFYGKYPIDEQAYREKKKRALEMNEQTKINKDRHYIEQRNRVFRGIKKEWGLGCIRLAEFCKKNKIPLKRTELGRILAEKDDETAI